MEFESAKKWSLRQFSTNLIVSLAPLTQSRVGRSESADVRLNWFCVAPCHASLIVSVCGKLRLRDLNSYFGTYVNNRKMKDGDTLTLSKGDVIGFGIESFQNATMEEMKCFFEVLLDDKESTKNASSSDEASDSSEQTNFNQETTMDTMTQKRKGKRSKHVYRGRTNKKIKNGDKDGKFRKY